MRRVTAVIMGVVNFFKWIDGLFAWSHGAPSSIVAMVVCLATNAIHAMFRVPKHYFPR